MTPRLFSARAAAPGQILRLCACDRGLEQDLALTEAAGCRQRQALADERVDEDLRQVEGL